MSGKPRARTVCLVDVEDQGRGGPEGRGGRREEGGPHPFLKGMSSHPAKGLRSDRRVEKGVEILVRRCISLDTAGT